MKKLLSFALALSIIVTCIAFLPQTVNAQPDKSSAAKGVPSAPNGASTAATTGAAAAKLDGLYLHIGSPIALSDGKILPLDSENPGLTPIVHKGRTLVPLRFVSEFFKADVNYNSETKAGIVKINGKTAEFPVGAGYYVLDGTRISLDTETLSVDGRIMLPLRVLCEQVLGLSVAYSSSVIEISKKTSLDDGKVNAVKAKIGMYIKASDLQSLTKYLEENADNWDYNDVINKGDVDEGAVTEPAPPPASAPPPAPSATPRPEAEAPMSPPTGANNSDSPGADASDGGSGGGHSSTNTQVEGVDEGDIIKTDGKYIYLSCYDSIRIVNAQGNMSLLAKIETPGYSIVDMYIDNGRLAAIGMDGKMVRRAPQAAGGKIHDYWVECVFVNVYDTSDMSDIKLLRTYEIEGNLTTSRKQDGYLYLLTSRYIWYNRDDMDFRPMAGENGALSPIPVSDIMIAPGCPANMFITLSAININDAEEDVTSETMTVNGYNSTQYMSNNAMYITTQDYMYSNGNNLSIAKFSVNGGKIGYAGSGSVRGSTNNQFSMDEYRGYLRIATTDWDGQSKNNLFVLDENMQVCGSVEGYAPGERIYSARFMGSRGYVVTFRQIDPLFVFDLSDPKNPKITGELKVPGFSTYLHPVSENIILGVGRDVTDTYIKDKNGNEVVVGQTTGGIKLSLFDVSDMGKPREIDNLILGDRGYSELLDNHKAVMFKADDSIMAFCAGIGEGFQSWDWWNGAFIISYAGNELSELGRIESSANDYIYYSYAFGGQRLVYIGNTLYYADNNVIRSFNLNTLAEIQTLRLG